MATVDVKGLTDILKSQLLTCTRRTVQRSAQFQSSNEQRRYQQTSRLDASSSIDWKGVGRLLVKTEANSTDSVCLLAKHLTESGVE